MSWLLALFLWSGSLLGPVVPEAWQELCPFLPSEHDRIGFNFSPLHGEIVSEFAVDTLHAAWYNDYQIQEAPDRPARLAFVQTLFAGGSNTLSPAKRDALRAAILANPGSIWLAGNEPDREGIQDNLLPVDYAKYYHEVYSFIKATDPTARVATAGIVQATPIRLRYLDAVLAAYQAEYGRPMPVDIWNIHNFVLREQLGSWGAGIPPGMEAYADEGKLYEIEDHGRFDLFTEQIIDFRRWMAANGYRNTPLIVSEFGILMPTFYGYPDEVVAEFLADTFTFFQTETDPNTGYPADDNRLVQAWSWFSLNERPYDIETARGFNGHLYDVAGARWTPAAHAFGDFTAPLADWYSDPAVAALETDTGYFVPLDRTTITVTVTLVNGGSEASDSGTLELWLGGLPEEGGRKVGEQPLPGLASHCRHALEMTFEVAVDQLALGEHQLWARIVPGADAEERRPDNNSVTGTFRRLDDTDPAISLWIPRLMR